MGSQTGYLLERIILLTVFAVSGHLICHNLI